MHPKPTWQIRFLPETMFSLIMLLSLQPISKADAPDSLSTALNDKGSSGETSTTAVMTDATTSATRNSIEIDITFGGSLCPVCLVAFQRRLLGTPGVLTAKVESLQSKSQHSGHPPKRAQALVVFAPDKISKSDLETMVRQNDFQFIKTQEYAATKP